MLDSTTQENVLTFKIPDEAIEAAAGDEHELGLMWGASCASTCSGCNMCC